MRIGVLFICSMLAGTDLTAQGSLRIYVEPIQNKGGDVVLRDALIDSLKKTKSFVIVDNPADADSVLSGFGETYVKGFVSRNHRVRYKNNDARPIYGGYLSVELKDKNDDTIWSNLVTPSRFGGGDIGKDLAGQLVARLTGFLAGSAATTKPGTAQQGTRKQ